MTTKVQIEESIEELRKLSRLVYQTYHDHSALVSQLNLLPAAARQALWITYQNAKGPVKAIRKQVAEILKDRDITEGELQTIIDDAKAENPNAYYRMYKAWYNLLYVFILANYKDSANMAIENLVMSITGALENPGYLKSVKFDFSGERETGSTRMWLAFFNSHHIKQDTAKQLFLSIENGNLVYNLYDRPSNKSVDERKVEDGIAFNATDMIDLFNAHLKEIENDNGPVINQIELKANEKVFKISMGPNDIDEPGYQFLLSDNLIMVHKNTKAIGQSNEQQGDVFTKKISLGDYFYLCRGNSLVLIGKITGNTEPVDYDSWGDDGWVQRSFLKIYESINENKYEGEQKWWTPNFRSTCWQIPSNEIALANRVLFKPFFSAEFIFDKNIIIPQPEPDNKMEPKKALNTILYGPPGTGKTFRMLEIIKSGKIIEQFENDKPDYEVFVNNYHWWELISLVLLEKKKATVPEIMEHELIKTKFSVSEIQHRPQRVWGALQSHTVLDCPNVKLNAEKRHGELIFFKEVDSAWRLNDENEFKSQFPFLAQEYSDLSNTKEIIKTKKHFTFTTCHQSLSYEDFIEGIKPILIDSSSEEDRPVQYENRKGYFFQACDKAAQRAGYLNLSEAINDSRENRKLKFEEANNKNQIYILFLDEINRCNISAVFGELITLIEDDKRLGAKNEIVDTLLPYSQTAFGVPSNLYIIGTMNTADRSVEALDTALRRRFSFEFMPPISNYVMEDFHGIPLKKIFSQINERISFLLDKDHQIGHSYFMEILTVNDLREVFKNKIIPLLKEYFYNDYRKIHLILGDGFVTLKNEKPEFAVNDNEEMARAIYSIIPIDDEFNIIEALNKTLAK